MDARAVVCFDPGCLIATPCPILYPEFGRSLWVFSGRVEGEHWKQCANILATSKSAGLVLELWWLVEASDAAKPPTVEAFRTSAPDALKLVLPPASEWLAVVWQHVGINHSQPTASAQTAVLRTQFDSIVHNSEAVAAQSYLLPLALRFLLDKDVFLIGRGDVAKKLRQIDLTASTRDVAEAKRRMRASLEECKRKLTENLADISDAPCNVLFIDDAVELAITAVFSKQSLPPLRLGWFLRLGTDEAKLSAWFDEQKAALDTAQTRFHQELQQQFEVVRQRVGRLPATKLFDDLSGAHASGTSIANAGQSHSNASTILRYFEQQASALGEYSFPQNVSPVERKSNTTDWYQTWFSKTLHVARQRPTRAVYWWTTLVSLALVIACVAMGIAPAPASNIQWVYIGKVCATLCSGVMVLSLFDLYLIRRRCNATVKRVQDALARVQQAHFLAAEHEAALARSSLRLMIVGLNVGLARAAVAAQVVAIQQGECHADQLNALLSLVDDDVLERTTIASSCDIVLFVRPEDQTPYWWNGVIQDGKPEIREGNTVLDFASNEPARRQLKRLAGVSLITVSSA